MILNAKTLTGNLLYINSYIGEQRYVIKVAISAFYKTSPESKLKNKPF